MYPIDGAGQFRAGRQAGTTLILALVLILLASLLAVFAMNVGIFEQRLSGNDVRARLVQQAAEGGLSQGIEYFKANFNNMMDPSDATRWQPCGATDTAFPCGTVPQCANGEETAGACPGDSAGVSTARRSNMYKFIGGGAYDVNGEGSSSDTMDTRSLPLDRLINTTNPVGTTDVGTVGNGYSVNYGTGALLCMVSKPSATGDPTECTTDSSKASSVKIVTLASTANIIGETASTTLTTMIGTQTTINNPVNAPPVVASGTITANGTLQIVTNPNSAGPGVPVSMWTRLDASKTGTPNTCYMDGFIRDQKNNATPAYEGVNSKIVTCDTCLCTSSLSYTDSGNKQTEGIDILDVDTIPQCTNVVTTNCKPNLNIKPGEFPCDLFEFTFGVKAYTDGDSDFFCETRTVVDYTAADGVTYKMGVDEAYLYQKATFIIPISANTSKVKASQLKTCDQILNDGVTTNKLQGSAFGLVWDQQGCGIGSNKQVGTVDKPVILVEDGNTMIQGRIFGLLFVRPDLYGNTIGPLDPTTGQAADGTACLQTNAGAAIYGAVVVQGQVCRINGTSSIIYEGTVLRNLSLESQLNPFSPVPGAWTDRFAY